MTGTMTSAGLEVDARSIDAAAICVETASLRAGALGAGYGRGSAGLGSCPPQEPHPGSILTNQGVKPRFSDIFGPSALRFLETLELRRVHATGYSTRCLIADFTGEIDRTTREIDARTPRRTPKSRCSARSAA
jgi:hypothetical protein